MQGTALVVIWPPGDVNKARGPLRGLSQQGMSGHSWGDARIIAPDYPFQSRTLAPMAPKFGTSGLRGLVTQLTDDLCQRYTAAFLSTQPDARAVAIGHDLRASSPRIAAAVARAAAGRGLQVLQAGAVPTPALALAAMARAAPSIMITGSHIPDDRNGLKFYTATGEITKDDEAAILAALPDARPPLGDPWPHLLEAAPGYVARYVDHFGPTALAGLRLGVYQHSAVGRDLLMDILAALGADPLALGRSATFVPVDTEAVASQTRRALQGWAAQHGLDAIVSTDGDADRPLLADAAGQVVPGDILGPLTARHLGAETLVTPVSSNTLVEAMGAFGNVHRTRIGSPHVIAGMQAAPATRVAGYEANGGFLLGFDVAGRDGRAPLPALMTRDAVLPIVAPLAASVAAGQTLADLVAALPQRHTASDRRTGVATDRALALIARLSGDPAARAAFFDALPPEAHHDLTDGLRVTFADGAIVHLRPSGNAPELRCYAETDDPATATALVKRMLTRAEGALEKSAPERGSVADRGEILR